MKTKNNLLKQDSSYRRIPFFRRVRPLFWILTTCMSGYVAADNITSTWIGTGDGTASWNSTSNWDTSTWPRNHGGDNYFAVIGDATGDRVITVPSIGINGFSINQTSMTGSTTLRFNGVLTILGDSAFGASTGVTNTTGDLSRVKFDLNNQTLNLIQFGTLTGLRTGGYTVGSSSESGGGTFVTRTWRDDLEDAQGINVEDNVTIQLAIGETSTITSKSTISSTSTIHLNYAVTNAVSFRVDNETPIGNLVIGSASNSAATKVSSTGSSTAGGPLRVLGDVHIHSYVGATGGAASELAISVSSYHRSLYVGGSFIDAGSDDFTYGNGNVRIYFNGGTGVEKTLSTGRSVQNAFQVGESAVKAGNIALGKNLTTTGNFTVLENSRLNLESYSLNSGSFIGGEGANLAFTFGSLNGQVLTEDLTLGEFNLELFYDGSQWQDGDDLVLFDYTGTFTGDPTLGQFELPEGWMADGLVHDSLAKTIYVSNLSSIPEPASMGLFLTACGLFLTARRRYSRE